MLLNIPFQAISTTGVDARVLTVIARAARPLTPVEVSEMAPAQTSTTAATVSLKRFTQQGVTLEHRAGRTTAYVLNHDHLLASAIVAIANVKSTLIEQMRAIIAEWQHQPTLAALFGSAARNDMHIDSDIDLFFLFPDGSDNDHTQTQVSDLADQVTRWTGNDTRPLVYFEHEVAPSPIFESITEEGIVLAGSKRSLTQLIRKATS